MKLPDSHRYVPPEETVGGACVATVAEGLLRWRVHGRLPGFYLDFGAAQQELHVTARTEIVEAFEEALDVLSYMSRPDHIAEDRWAHWGKAFQGLAVNPETILAISGDEFRKFHLAMWDFAHALGHPQ
jgi:hypothetical protein